MAPPTPLFAVLANAARAFNSGHYFEAHELLEDGLEQVPDDLWDLVVGLVQIAVGYHKVTQQLWRGAAGMLERGLKRIAPFADGTAGIDLDALRQRAGSDCEALRAGTFDPRQFSARPPHLVVRRPKPPRC